ncbi:MAG TPA: ribosome biogenesis GTPase Der [Fimbriimonadaceae bacterium]|nr:ribosome biogenesis GTPase Der [Fimbriimonadaceae bacterium]
MKSTHPVVVIVGRPNVGKSTLFNRIIGRRAAVVEDTPGITRDRLYAEAAWGGRTFTLVDTGGIIFGEDDPLAVQIRVQANIALAEADVVIFLVDAEAGVNPGDLDLANALRGIKVPVFLASNKADNSRRDQYVNEFYQLGVGEELYAVSALHGRGVADLLDRILDSLPPSTKVEDEREELRLAIIGRPNVGKSSMVNAFTGEQRMIVSDIAGTTRDAIDTELEYKGEKIRLIDTAGIRRRGKIQGTVEYYMVDRAQRAIERADCAIVVVDGKEGLTDGDKRIAKIAFDAGKACVFAVNKWDLMQPEGFGGKLTPLQKDFIRIIRDQLPELHYATVAFTSAKENMGLTPVLDAALDALENYSIRIPTGPLNRMIGDAAYARPYTTGGKALKIYYATQGSTRPPTISLFCNDPELMHFSYQRYIMNKIREVYPMPGTPIRLILKASHKDRFSGAPRRTTSSKRTTSEPAKPGRRK